LSWFLVRVAVSSEDVDGRHPEDLAIQVPSSLHGLCLQTRRATVRANDSPDLRLRITACPKTASNFARLNAVCLFLVLKNMTAVHTLLIALFLGVVSRIFIESLWKSLVSIRNIRLWRDHTHFFNLKGFFSSCRQYLLYVHLHGQQSTYWGHALHSRYPLSSTSNVGSFSYHHWSTVDSKEAGNSLNVVWSMD
jgi:hypothetical protein